ncbi:hypothetical protein ACS0TY_022045 [Phlomoides rotata]
MSKIPLNYISYLSATNPNSNSVHTQLQSRFDIKVATGVRRRSRCKFEVSMARLCRRKTEILLVVEEIIFEIVFMLCMMRSYYRNKRHFQISNVNGMRTYKMVDRIPKQIEHMNDLIGVSDSDCLDNLLMNRSTFNSLCYLLRHSGGLFDSMYVSVGEQVALFLSVLAHHTKWANHSQTLPQWIKLYFYPNGVGSIIYANLACNNDLNFTYRTYG